MDPGVCKDRLSGTSRTGRHHQELLDIGRAFRVRTPPDDVAKRERHLWYEHSPDIGIQLHPE